MDLLWRQIKLVNHGQAGCDYLKLWMEVRKCSVAVDDWTLLTIGRGVGKGYLVVK